MEFLYVIGFAIFSYVMVNKVKEKYPKLNVDPWMYVAGSFLIGALWCWIYLAYKVHEHVKYGKYMVDEE